MMKKKENRVSSSTLKAGRTLTGLGIREVALALGVSVSAVKRMEFAGDHKPVSSALLTRYAVLLQIHGVEVSNRGATLIDPPGDGRIFSVFRSKEEDIKAVVEIVSAGWDPEKAAQGLPEGTKASELYAKADEIKARPEALEGRLGPDPIEGLIRLVSRPRK